MRVLFAEFLGTFALVFAGCGAVVVNAASGGAVTHVGVALTFGLVVLTAVYALGDVSGAHLNPAVTAGFWLAGRFPVSRLPAYVAAQCVGGLAAAGLLRLLFPADATLGATLPAGSAGQSFLLEVILTAMLMFVALSVATGAKERGHLAAVAVGAVVALGAMFAGPVSGASMNPARSLAPALVSGRVESLWVYLTAPLVGAAAAVAACRGVHEPGCCAAPAAEGRV
jgi:aquaporin NIP